MIAANGIRLVVEEQRTTTTSIRKDGTPGASKIAYGESEQALTWLWRFIDGARNAAELYGRVLVVFAAQAYAHDLVLPVSQRRSSALPASHNDRARKAFARLTKGVLPGSHVALARALQREAHRYEQACEELAAAERTPAAVAPESSSLQGDDAR